LLFGTLRVEGIKRRDWRYAAVFERIEPFFALAAKPVRTFDGEVCGANIDVYAFTSGWEGGGS